MYTPHSREKSHGAITPNCTLLLHYRTIKMVAEVGSAPNVLFGSGLWDR